MFFLIDSDDTFDGMAGLIGVAIKYIILFVIIGYPILYLLDGGIAPIVGLGLGLTAGALVLNIVTIIGIIKTILKKEQPKMNPVIFFVCFIILLIIGYFLPVNLFYLRIKGISSMIVASGFISLVYVLLANYDTFKKKAAGKKFKIFKLYIKKILSIIFIPLAICYISSFLVYLLMDQPIPDQLYNKLNTTLESMNSIYYYQNDICKEKRIKELGANSDSEVIEYLGNYIKNDLYIKNEEKENIENYQKNSSIYSTYWTQNDIKGITYLYFKQDDTIKKMKEEYGIYAFSVAIKDENTLVMQSEDLETLKYNYYVYDLNQNKVTGTINKKEYIEMYNKNKEIN